MVTFDKGSSWCFRNLQKDHPRNFEETPGVEGPLSLAGLSLGEGSEVESTDWLSKGFDLITGASS